MTDLAQIVALAIRAGRRAHGVSQRELAQRVGLTRATLARIEQGNTGVALETVASALAGVGLKLVVLDRDGQRWQESSAVPADVQDTRDLLRRRLPAHLVHDDGSSAPGWWISRRLTYDGRGGRPSASVRDGGVGYRRVRAERLTSDGDEEVTPEG